MKKVYLNPALRVVKIQHAKILCASPTVTSIEGGTVTFGGASSNNEGGIVRGRSFGWDDEE